MVKAGLGLAVVTVLVAGCGWGNASSCPTPPCTSGADAGIDAGPALVSLVIAPVDPVLTSVDGSHPQQSFTVTATYSDGTSGPLDGSWSTSSYDLGDLDVNLAQFTAAGTVGGTTQVMVDVIDAQGIPRHAETSITVVLQRTVVVPGTPVDAATHFTTLVTDPARAVVMDYPLDQAVMPQNVYPADVQWEIGAAGDIYRVSLHKTHMDGVAYVLYDGNFHWPVDDAMWRQFSQSDGTSLGTITVDRWDHVANQAVAGTPVHLKFARAALVGSVYYWDIAAGRVVRIDDGTATRTQIMPSPPPSPKSGEVCVGCHVVSNDGRWFVGRLGGGDNIGAIFDLTRDLTVNPAPTTYTLSTTSQYWWFSTFSPDATRLLYEENNAMGLLDPQTGLAVPLATGSTALPASAATHPAWSPDGTQVAYVSGANAWGGDNTAGDISVIPVTGPDKFGPPVKIQVANTLPGGACDSYPTWSPDSKYVAFAHGTGSRSELRTNALYLMGRDGANAVRLDNADGGASADKNYQPRFSPFVQGGYYWMTFLSKRPYGNTQVGTKGHVPPADVASGAYQQLWVAAISTSPTPGQDPSEVAYWIPGQATTSQNISAFWAPRACRQNGNACNVGAECCSGVCNASHLCEPPPAGSCRKIGQTCGGPSDCCQGLTCTKNVCSYVIP